MLQLPELYTNHLKKYLNYPQYLIFLILINLFQDYRCVRLEELANRFPHPIQLRSRIKKLQRFLSLEQFNLKNLWLPIIETWIKQKWNSRESLYLVIDRSQWREINLLMVSLVYDQRAIPLYFQLLPKKGSSNLAQQKQVLEPVFELLRNHQIIVLGDREFCGVDLAKWLKEEKNVYFCLRLKKNEYALVSSSYLVSIKRLRFNSWPIGLLSRN